MAIALDKPLLHVAAEQHVNAMQHAMAEPPAKPCSAGAAIASAPAPAHAPPAPPPFASTATSVPEAPQHRIARAHGTEEGELAWTEQDNNHLSFACAAEGS